MDVYFNLYHKILISSCSFFSEDDQGELILIVQQNKGKKWNIFCLAGDLKV